MTDQTEDDGFITVYPPLTGAIMEYRDQRIAIRLTYEEKNIIEKAADAASIQPAVYVRAMAIKAAKEQLK